MAKIESRANEFTKAELTLIWTLLAEEITVVRSHYKGSEPFEQTACYAHLREAIRKAESQVRDIERREAREEEPVIRIRG